MDVEVSKPEDIKVDMQSILKQHRVQWVFRTSIGVIIMHHLTRMAHAKVVRYITSIDPDYEKMCNHYVMLKLKLAYPQGQKQPIIDEMDRTKRYLAQYSDLYAVECFIDPLVNTPDELDALMTNLSDDEFSRLTGILQVLTSMSPPGEVDASVMNLCKSWGISVAPDITAENMTVHQASLLSMADSISQQETVAMLEGGGL